MPAKPPKIATANTGFQAVIDQAQAAGAEAATIAGSIIYGPWNALATAVGQSAPANVNRANRAIRSIRGAGR